MMPSVIRVSVVLLIATSSLFAQYVATPATTPFIPVSTLPGAVPMGTLNGCDDCVETVPLTFTFPWLAGNLTSVNVTSNGAVILDGSTGSMCCSALALSSTSPSRVSFAQEDLDPATLGACWYLDFGTSIIISFEGVSFFPGTATGSVNVQVELYDTGDIEIRYGSMNTAGNNIAAGISDATQQLSPQSILPQFGANGITTGGTAPQNTGVRFVVSGPAFETNSAESSLDFDGVQGGPFIPAVTTVCTGQASTATLASSLASTSFEVVLAASAPVPNGFATGGGQIINVDLTSPIFLNGATVPVFQPFTPASIPVTPTVTGDTTAQMGVLDPAHPDGVQLSQAASLRASAGTPPGSPQPGPTGDDGTQQVTLTGPPNCGPSVPFCGTTYTECYIASNGRITFMAADGDFSPTLSEALGNNPFFGHWTDFNPSAGGSIDWTMTANSFTVNWNGVPHFGETNANNLSLSIDDTGMITMDVSGIQANPLSGASFTTGDAVFFGVSCGGAGGATDGGPTNFTVGGSAVNTIPTDMVYDFIGTGGIGGTGGFCPSVSNLQTGSGLLTLLPSGAGPGGYIWIGS